MNLNTAPLHKAFWHYTLPSLAALLVSGTYQIIDGIFVGHYIGADGLAGINFAWPFIGVMLAVGMMIGIGSGAQASLSLGAGETTNARRYIGAGILLPLIAGLPIAFILLATIDGFLNIQGATGDAAEFATEYLVMMSWAAPIVLASIVFPFLVRNLGSPRMATVAILVGAISNIFFDALFIAWLGWGLMGAALATILGESLSILVCVYALLKRQKLVTFCLQDLLPNLTLIHRITTTGFSSMIMYLYISFSVVLHNLLLMKYGSSLEVAAYSITGYLMAFYYLAAEGVAGGMQPLVSYYYGAKQIEKVKQTFTLALKVGVGSGIVFTFALLIFPTFFATVFNRHDSELLDITTWAIRLQLFALFLDGFLVIAACWFQALGKGRPAIFVSMGNIIIQLPFLGILPALIGQSGVWLAMPVSNICLSAVVIYLLIRQIKSL
ncbi:MATE family efflux transporter [Nitrincola schmidtii]|uniref:MATE family efflux transporter n=1 Tax=Nitrincola schmidtii TaxID=1730894 RepID=UPI00124C14EF|nr:MATE family efflux transporter [Nitrincola schmidtii]